MKPNIKNRRLSPLIENLYYYIVGYFLEHGECPTQVALASDLGFKSYMSIRRPLALLELKDLITKDITTGRIVLLDNNKREAIADDFKDDFINQPIR